MSDDPSHGPWICYHCGEVCKDRQSARLHFGRDERSEAACIIKAGAEGSLLKALRNAEEQADDAIQAMHNESTDAAKAYHRQQCRHTQSLIAAEETGYERGLADSHFPEMVEVLREARKALHDHYVAWDGEPEDAVPLQLARSRCDALLSKLEAPHG